jgi:hypothetical protein
VNGNTQQIIPVGPALAARLDQIEDRLIEIERLLTSVLDRFADSIIEFVPPPSPCRPDGKTSGERFCEMHGLGDGEHIARAIREASCHG